MKNISFEVQHGNGSIGNSGRYSFETKEEALEFAKEFKNNPKKSTYP